MKFNKINIENWARKEHFNHYFNNLPCTYSMSVNIDITKLLQNIKDSNKKLYPVMIYAISNIVNNNLEFKMAINENNEVGYYEKVNPSYTVLNEESKLFSSIWTEYIEDFNEFYESCMDDINTYKVSNAMMPKEFKRSNLFSISCITWTSFTGFNLNLQKGYDYLPPIFTIGKYFEDKGKILLPLAIQVNHSVCDGYHVGKFVNELQSLCYELKL